jgi:hypothetical protein
LPFRDPVDALRDILDAIDMIERFTEGMDFEAFREDPKTVAAVERKVLVICRWRRKRRGPVWRAGRDHLDGYAMDSIWITRGLGFWFS